MSAAERGAERRAEGAEDPSESAKGPAELDRVTGFLRDLAKSVALDFVTLSDRIVRQERTIRDLQKEVARLQAFECEVKEGRANLTEWNYYKAVP